MRRILLVLRLLGMAALLLPAACGHDATEPNPPGLSFAVVSGDGQSVVVGTALPQPVVVQATDTRGRLLKNVSIGFEVTSGGGSASPPSATTDKNGLAQTSWTLGTSAAQAQQLEARVTSTGALVGTFSATALPGPAAQVAIKAGNGQTAVHGTAVAIPPSVLVTDQYNNPVPGASVTFAVTAGGGSVAGAAATTTANGIATVASWALGSSVGTDSLTATVTGLTPVTFSATATVGPPAHMVIQAGNGQSAQVNDAVAVPPAVRITDAGGNAVAGAQPTFAIIQGGGAVSGATPVSGPDGVAAVVGWTLGSTPGTNVLRATIPGVADTVSFTATATPGPVSATQSGVSAAPLTIGASAGSTVSTVTVTARDAGGFAISGATVTLAASGAGNTITQPSAPTDASGRASGTLSSTAAGQKVVSATINGVAITATVTVNVTNGAAVAIVVQAGDGQTGYTNTDVAIRPAALVRDAFGNPVSGAGVTFAVIGGGGGVCCAQPVPTDPTGIATIGRWTLGLLPGPNALKGTVAGVSDSALFTATAVTQAHSIEVYAGDHQGATVGTAVALQPTVLVRNAQGAPLRGVLVEFSVTGGGGAVVGQAARQTDSNGLSYPDAWTVGPTPGPNTLLARVAGTDITLTFTATGDAGSWTRLADMPTLAVYIGGAELGGILYTAGGANATNYLGTLEAYDPASNAWASRAPMPTPRAEVAAAALNGQLYVVGGENGNALGTVEAYDPATDSWTVKSPLPTPRASLAVAVANGVLYAIGGWACLPAGPSCSWQSLSTVEAYDPLTDSWTTRASMPTPRHSLGAGVVNGIIYAVGGQTAGGANALATVEAYDPATNSWTPRAPTPTPRGGLGVGVINGLVYAAGGDVPPVGSGRTLEAYDPVSNAWTVKAAMSTARQYLVAAAVNGLLYVTDGNTQVLEAYRP